MKDYYYISERKVDTYFSQLKPSIASKFNVEFTGNLGAASAKLTSIQPSLNKFTRLAAVACQIEEEHEIGSTLYPSEWVKDRLTVRSIYPKGLPDVFLLVGKNDANEICALIGASQHITQAGAKPEPSGSRASHFPDFARALYAEAILEERNSASEGASLSVLTSTIREIEICGIIETLFSNATSPAFNVEFLARTVFDEKDHQGQSYKIFTPLFVEVESPWKPNKDSRPISA